MDLLEQNQQAMREELNQVKGKMDRIFDLVQALDAKLTLAKNHSIDGNECREASTGPLGDPLDQERLQLIEKRLKAIEGASHVGFEASEVCLVLDVVIPPKFKVPEFAKYEGLTCPKGHLIMYCRKMASCSSNDKLLIHFFQESLTGASLRWYMQLERSKINSWNDLANAFIKQYKYNMDMAPGRSQLQTMVKGGNESFKEYAQRWRGIAAQVEPPLSEKEMVTTFINTLQQPFYDMMIGNISSSFSDLIVVGERVETGITSGRITNLDIQQPSCSMGQEIEEDTNAAHHNMPSWGSGSLN